MGERIVEVPFVRPGLLSEVRGIVAGCTTRWGGVSPPPFNELNLGLGTDDSRENVFQNRRLVARQLGFLPENLAVAGQVHGVEVETIGAGGLHPNRDGLVTTTRGILLAMVAADCAPVLLCDPSIPVIGACHAGWRGAAGGVVERTVEAMKALGADPTRLLAWIGPSIGPEAFQVGPEVAREFDPEEVRFFPGDDLPHVDLVSAIRRSLLRAGLASASIEADGRCTATRPGEFFSHRAQHGRTGRMMGLIGILPAAPRISSRSGGTGNASGRTTPDATD